MIFVNTFDNLAFTSNNYERETDREKEKKGEKER